MYYGILPGGWEINEGSSNTVTVTNKKIAKENYPIINVEHYYYREDNDIGDKETFKNKSSLNISNENKLSFEVTKDLRDDFTQYYDIIYSYETDCISIDLKYNKSFFRDGNLEPNKSLSFLLKIIPFTEIGVPNVGSLVGK